MQQQKTTTVSGGTVYVAGPGGKLVPYQPFVAVYASYPQPGGPAPSAVKHAPTVVEQYKSAQSLGLGITLIIIGVLAVTFNVAALGADYIGHVGHGIWCGTLFIITGSFGVIAKNKTRSMILTFMILGIISAVMSAVLLFIGYGGVAGNLHCDSFCPECNCTMRGVAMEAALALLAIPAAAVAIWGSAIGCRTVCCCVNSSNHDTAIPLEYQQTIMQQPPAQMLMTTDYHQQTSQQQGETRPVQQPLLSGQNQYSTYSSAPQSNVNV